jgi:hypothetical protein
MFAIAPPGGQNPHNPTRRPMSDVVYTANIRIERIKGPHRHAWLPAHEGPVEFGVHSAVAEHYGVTPEREITTTLDYVMAATGG